MTEKIHSVWALMLAVAVVASCAGANEQSDEEDPLVDGKADSIRNVIEHDTRIQEIHEIGGTFDGTASGHAWRFELGGNERVQIFTARYSGATSRRVVDTVVYLFKRGESGWGSYIRRNDDESRGSRWSRIVADLGPGEYRILVKGHLRSTRGQFGINLTCADGACEATAPNNPDEPTEEGTGTADRPGTGALSIKVPIVDDDGQPMARFNDALSRAHLPTFPQSITVSMSQREPSAEFMRLHDQAARDDVSAVTNVEQAAFQSPGFYVSAGMCYTGDATRVMELLSSVTDSIMSDMFVDGGWRTADKSAYGEWHEPTRAAGIYEEWRAFDPSNGDVLLVFSDDDDGTPQTATIPRCR